MVPGFTLSSAALAPEESEAPLHVKGAYGEMITSNCSTVSGSSKSKLTNFASTLTFFNRLADMIPSVLPNTEPAASGRFFTRKTLFPIFLVTSPSFTATEILSSPPLLRVTSAM